MLGGWEHNLGYHQSQSLKNLRKYDKMVLEAIVAWRSKHLDGNLSDLEIANVLRKAAKAAYNKKWREENYEKIAAYNKKYREENFEKVAVGQRRCREKNREEKLAIRRKKYAENKEREQRRKREWYKANCQKVRACRRRFREENIEKVRASEKFWRKTHPEIIRAKNWRGRDYHRIYMKTRRNNDTQFRLACKLRSRLGYALKGNFKTGSAVRDLGCSIPELKSYLESLFLPGMVWDNYGEWVIDHHIPLSSFNLTDREQFLKACHWSNLQPLWAEDNLSKGDKLPEALEIVPGSQAC